MSTITLLKEDFSLQDQIFTTKVKNLDNNYNTVSYTVHLYCLKLEPVQLVHTEK